jgi:hypothetical protein
MTRIDGKSELEVGCIYTRIEPFALISCLIFPLFLDIIRYLGLTCVEPGSDCPDLDCDRYLLGPDRHLLGPVIYFLVVLECY